MRTLTAIFVSAGIRTAVFMGCTTDVNNTPSGAAESTGAGGPVPGLHDSCNGRAPNGYCNAEVIDRVRQSGYRLAFTTRRGLVSAGDDRFTVCRYNIHEAVTATTPMFLARVTGLL